MLQQLQYSGVVEMVRIRRAGYPGRFSYAAFAARFGALCYRDEMAMTAKERAALQPEARRALSLPPTSPHTSPTFRICLIPHVSPAPHRCARILEAANLHPDRHYALGRTMVFLRNTVEGGLNALTAKQNLVIEWFQRTARCRSAKQQVTPNPNTNPNTNPNPNPNTNTNTNPNPNQPRPRIPTQAMQSYTI